MALGSQLVLQSWRTRWSISSCCTIYTAFIIIFLSITLRPWVLLLLMYKSMTWSIKKGPIDLPLL